MASGAGTDILYELADQAFRDERLRRRRPRTSSPNPDPERIFQPEIGCSEPTFTGSDPEVAAAAGLVFSLGPARAQRPGRPASGQPKSLFLARLPGDPCRPAHVYLDWPNDLHRRRRAERLSAPYPPAGDGERMRAEALTARRFPPSWETGGLLFGYIDDACRVAWVTAVAGPHRTASAANTTSGSARPGWLTLSPRYRGGRWPGAVPRHVAHPPRPAGPGQPERSGHGEHASPRAPPGVPRRATVIVGGDPTAGITGCRARPAGGRFPAIQAGPVPGARRYREPQPEQEQ